MRVNEYSVLLDHDRMPYLVKERGSNVAMRQDALKSDVEVYRFL